MSINWRKLREVDPPTDGTKVVFCDVYGNFLSGTFRLEANTALSVVAKPGIVDLVAVAGTWDIVSPAGPVDYFYDCNNSEDLAKLNDFAWWCLASELGVPANMEGVDEQASNAQKIRDIITKLDSALVDIDAVKQSKNVHSSKMHDRARSFVESAIESLEEM